MRCSVSSPAVSLSILLAVAIFPAFADPGGSSQAAAGQAASTTYLGFDRNIYPGDDAFRVLRKTFSFSGYWLSPPPGEKVNTWRGKRELLRSQGFGFAVLYRGRSVGEIKTQAVAKQKGAADARSAATSAKAEGFAPGTIIFLDVEEGGRLPAVYHAYLRAWTDELVEAGYRSGVYCSGIPVDEGGGVTIITADDIRNNIGAREIVYWVYNEVCPPSPGCRAPQNPPPVSASGVPYAAIWQTVRSPRPKDSTARCATTYRADGNCYAPGDTAHVWFLDVNVASTPDPSSAAGSLLKNAEQVAH
jgi:Domain of unknown function (DUF1906)